jgi:hypothetical protein
VNFSFFPFTTRYFLDFFLFILSTSPDRLSYWYKGFSSGEKKNKKNKKAVNEMEEKVVNENNNWIN